MPYNNNNNNNNFQVHEAAQDDEITKAISYLKDHIDGDIESGDTMAKLHQRKKLAEFIQTHTRTRHYSFSIKKCGIDLCMVCFEPRDREMLERVGFLPDPMPSEDPDHYMPYQVSSIRVLRPQISGSSFHYVKKPFFICNCH